MKTEISHSRWFALLGAAALLVLPAMAPRAVHAAGDARATSGTLSAPGAEALTATSGTLSARAAAGATSGTLAAPPRVAVSIGPSTATLAAEKDLFLDQNQIKLNFHNAQINTVLDYLARAAGFVIVRDTEPTGTVDCYSPRPLNKDEAVDLLNSVLAQKGYTAIRNDRLLVITTRDLAAKADVPIKQGADPELIPKSETIVTQIIPVKHAIAMRLIDNLRPLLSATAVVTANESSNAILLTDSQVNIKRMVTIIKALDTAISDVATIKVHILKYALATTTADVVNQLFQTPTNGSNAIVRGIQRAAAAGRGARGGGGFGPAAAGGMAALAGMAAAGGAGGGGNANNGETGQSDARDAASRVMAVADDRTNAVIISAPEEIIPTIEDTINQLDINTDEVTDVKVFFLQHADATDTAAVIMSTFSGTGQTSTAGAQRGGNQQRGGTAQRGGATAARGGAASASQSQRQALANTVVATSDLRTNAVIVTAGADMMRQVADIINQLDNDPAKSQSVHMVVLKNANPNDVATLLSPLFPAPAGTTTNRNTNTTNRTGTTNASTNNANRTGNNANRTGGTGSTGFGGGTGGGGTRMGN